MLAAVLALSGCKVGPDFRKPAAPAATSFTALPLPTTTASASIPQGEAQRIVSGRDIPAEWWTLFQSQPLNDLITQAVQRSPNLAAAQAALREAAELRRAQFGTLFPTVDAGFSATRQKFSGASFGQPNVPSSTFSLYNASVNVAYNLDLTGGPRRALEASQAQLDYQRFLLEGSYLTLTSNLVTTAVQQASLKARIQAINEMLAAQEEQVRLTERRLELGAGTRPELLAQQSQLAQTRTNLPPLQKELAQSRHQMAVLAGRFPSEAAALPEFDLAGLKLPEELPLSLPSELVRQRPDVLAAEEQLHQASAQIGVATSNLFPKITLTGSFGPQATTFGDLFTSTPLWSIGANVLQPIFRGGELQARRRAANAAYEQAEAQYRVTVLQAFQNVADVLRALEMDAQALKAQAEAEQSARASLELTRRQYTLGAVNYLFLLDAERQYLQARITLAQAQAARLADSAALFQALGGGWWNRDQGDNKKQNLNKQG
ncbi:histidine kinase [Geomonas silvestris]|uniref:Histidine kinase n=1 Tax=Geomonas silvestris TaxID=2740184 RepID=A0A6V8MD10_9BACT|nr:efflux transporter outer membrane subunit [Geomonas silvestris]GFO57826.1 histidine kinase [Geomonas silvestris]